MDGLHLRVGPFHDGTRAYVCGDGHVLILPLALRRVPARPQVAMSMPFGWGTGGLVSSRGYLLAEEIGAVVADLACERALVIGIRPGPRHADAWEASVPPRVVRTTHMTQTVDLASGFDAVWRRFSPAVRSHCRKAERRAVTIERDDAGRLIPTFDLLYRMSVDRWARQQHEPLSLARWRAKRRDPAQKFATVARRLGRSCRVWVAWRAGEAVASIIELTHGYHSTMWRAAINKDAIRGSGANELLHRAVISAACESGRRFYHLGESAPSSELARTKRGLGADELYETGYRFERVPLTAANDFVRQQVKRLIRFRD